MRNNAGQFDLIKIELINENTPGVCGVGNALGSAGEWLWHQVEKTFANLFLGGYEGEEYVE